MMGRIVWILMLLACSAWGNTKEIQSFKEMDSELSQGIPAETLLVFDIDNTLITTTTPVGSDPWYYCLYTAYGQLPQKDPVWDRRVLSMWNGSQKLIQVRPTEAFVPAWVAEKQARGFKTMALTARSLSVLDTTLKQLQSTQIQLTGNAPVRVSFDIDAKLLAGREPARYVDGVLAVGESNPKGPAFLEFLKHSSYKPKRVVFVDDKIKNTRTMDAAMSTTSLPFTAFRYGAMDASVAKFQCKANEVKTFVKEHSLEGLTL